MEGGEPVAGEDVTSDPPQPVPTEAPDTPDVDEHNPNDTTHTKVFVGGLAWTSEASTLRNYFHQFGEIQEAVVIMDRHTNRSKGYGFVTFLDPKSAAAAVANPNPTIDHRKANCNLAALGVKKKGKYRYNGYNKYNYRRTQTYQPQFVNPAALGQQHYMMPQYAPSSMQYPTYGGTQYASPYGQYYPQHGDSGVYYVPSYAMAQDVEGGQNGTMPAYPPNQVFPMVGMPFSPFVSYGMGMPVMVSPEDGGEMGPVVESLPLGGQGYYDEGPPPYVVSAKKDGGGDGGEE